MSADRSEREVRDPFGSDDDGATHREVALGLLAAAEDGPAAFLEHLLPRAADLDARALTEIVTLMVPLLAIGHGVNAREALEALYMAVPTDD
jgi:hypothetical protein